MKLDNTQAGVAKGMVLGLACSVVLICIGFQIRPPEISGTGLRVGMLGVAILLPTLALIHSIARLARHRFMTPQDIDGSALIEGTEDARLLQSILQNTLEQFAIVLGVYCTWCFIMPKETLMVPVLCSFLFILGRVLFVFGYKYGAAKRALGFTLTFYPTVLMVLVEIVYVCWRMAS